MAEEESMAVPEDELDEFYGGIYHSPNSRNLSRLSVCTSSFTTNESFDLYEENDAREGGGGRDVGYSCFCGGGDDEGVTDEVGSYLSMLSIDNFDADAEFSEEDEEDGEEEEEEGGGEGEGEGEGEGLSSFSSCSMLGVSPLEAWRARRGMAASKEEYASDDETWKDKENGTKKKKKTKVGFGGENGSRRWGRQNRNDGGGGESECGGGGGSSLMVMTRAKGGNRRLWMDMEEVKACRELGLELELGSERTIEIPGRISLSGSVDTGSSGGNSPIANWRISSPGDDPRDVKARLKVWAQMVVLASASLHRN